MLWLSWHDSHIYQHNGAIMKVLVIGGGVIGVTTAYFLSQAGMAVTVLESRERGGLEASAGNAGFLSPSDAFAWASPSSLKLAIRSLLNPELGIQYKIGFDPMLWRWSLEFLGQCRRSKWERNSHIKYRLAEYSLHMLNELRRNTKIDFDASDKGIVYASRDTEALKDLKLHFSFLQDRGLKLEYLGRDALLEKLPVLKSSKESYAGAVYSPGCKTGDSAKFSQALAAWCEKNGNCQFEWGTSVERIFKKQNRIEGVWTSKGEFKADAYVLAAGAYSGLLAKQLGIRLPIYPIKGFSITAPIIDEGMAPTMGFDDTQKLVAISRLGDRIRIASSAVFDGFNKNHSPDDFRAILNLAKEVFPNVADYEKAEYWAGLRPMTPSSVPIPGPSSIENLFLNVGHGHLGWTMACGTGKVVADILAGRVPDIDVTSFRSARA
jgi:D-amino-acid dehydrogenase